MVAACHVILLDLWWNPTTEDQAIDRAHRIGQTRPVTVLRLTVKDTVEDRILALQVHTIKLSFAQDRFFVSDHWLVSPFSKRRGRWSRQHSGRTEMEASRPG
ncbi:Helicase-like transcription factor CHR28 [Linum perenne]